MRILQLVSTRGVSGAAIYAQRLIQLLHAHGHAVHLAAPRDSWISRQFGGQVPWLPTDFPLDQTGLAPVARFCRDHGIALTHSHATRSHAFGCRLARLTGLTHLAHAHSHHWGLHWFRQQNIIALTAASARRIRRFYFRRADQVAVLPNFADTQAFRPPAPAGDNPLRRELGLTAGERVIVCPARVFARKGQLHLVRAFAGIRERHCDVRLLLVGQIDSHPRYVRQVRHEIARRGLEDRVMLTGFRPDLAQLLPHAHLVALPSLAEPFSLGALEAMACGVPLIATRVGGFPAMVLDGVNGYLVPPADHAALAAALDRVLSDPVRHRQLGENARRQVVRHFSADRHRRDFEQLVRQRMLLPSEVDDNANPDRRLERRSVSQP